MAKVKEYSIKLTKSEFTLVKGILGTLIESFENEDNGRHMWLVNGDVIDFFQSKIHLHKYTFHEDNVLLTRDSEEFKSLSNVVKHMETLDWQI